MADPLEPPPSRLLQAAARIVDGGPVEWPAFEVGIEPALVTRLKQIQALAGGFTRAGAAAAHPRFAHLELATPLGHGGGGTVYRAFDPLLQRPVALKLLRHGDAAGDAERQLQEAQRLARIDHPNVLKVHGAAIEAGVVGFWSELVDGQSLAAWIDAHPRPGAQEIVAVGLELCAALAAIHAAGLTHGDLKPENVLRHRSGHWVLVDFGSCVASGEADHSGTPLYLAPERFGGATPPGPRVDIYSLGAVLFRLASGRCPVEAGDREGLLRQHAAGRRLRLLDLRPELPSALVAAIESALQADPGARHASAGAFAAALSASTHRPRAQAWRPGVRVATLLLAVLVGLGLWQTDWSPAPAAIELRLLKATAGSEFELRDGDRVQPGEALALEYRNPRQAWVYVLNEDAEGARFQLFPLAGGMPNPLPGGSLVRLPGRVGGREVDWQITSRGGRERFHVLIADAPIAELEAAALSQSSFGRPVQDPGMLAAVAARERGIGGLSERVAEASRSAPIDRWLGELQARHPGLQTRRFELANP